MGINVVSFPLLVSNLVRREPATNASSRTSHQFFDTHDLEWQQLKATRSRLFIIRPRLLHLVRTVAQASFLSTFIVLRRKCAVRVHSILLSKSARRFEKNDIVEGVLYPFSTLFLYSTWFYVGLPCTALYCSFKTQMMLIQNNKRLGHLWLILIMHCTDWCCRDCIR